MSRRARSHRSRRTRTHSPSSVNLGIDALEPRRLLCALHLHEKPVELRPDLVGVNAPPDGGAPAVINWVNRGQANDRFGAVFGAGAAAARSVVDRVIIDYMQMIESFNYSDGSNVYNLTVSMDTRTGVGGAANLSTTLGGKPKSGSLTLRSGDDGAGDGWFIDPDAALNFNSAEFLGSIENPFAGDATSGGPADDLADFYTVAAAEVAHCLGLFGGTGAVPMWDAHTTNTGIADNAEGGNVGNFWTFEGPSVRHLMTGNNAGAGGNAFNGAVHSSGGTANINFASTNWRGTEDAGNAIFEGGRRYLIPDTLGLMFHDAYGYGVAPAHTRDTFHSVLNRQTGELTIRGGFETASDDDISVTLSGSNLLVSVNVGNDVPGSGALPGAGNLPAYTSSYFVGSVDSIRIEGRDGNDDILLDVAPAGIPVTVDAGGGDDTIRLGDSSNTLNGIDANVTVFGGTGTNAVVLDDSTGDAFDDTYVFDVSGGQFTFDRGAFPLLTMSSIQNVSITTSGGFETFDVNRLPVTTNLTIRAGGGNDTVNLSPLLDDLAAVAGDVSLVSETGTDTINLFDTAVATATTFSLDNGGVNHVLDRALFGSVSFGTGTEAVNLSTGGGANTFNLVELNSFTALTINAGGGNDHLNLGTPASQTLDLLDGPVVFNGELGTDDVVLSDQASAALNTYTFTSDTLDRVGFGLLDFGGAVETVTLNGGTAANTYVIDPSLVSLAADVTVNAQASADTFEVAPGSNSMQLVINADLAFNGGGGSDAINLHDSASTVSFPYAIDLDSVTRGASPVNYSGVELITLDGATGSNAFSVVANTAELVLDGNDGNDSLVVGGAAQNLDNIDGNITFTGGPGTDTLELRDQQNAAAGTYLVTSTTFDRTAFPLLTYGTLETFTVQGGTAGNPFVVQSLATATALVLFGNGGNDQFLLGSAANNLEPLDGAITVHGGANSDSIVINDQAELLGLGFTVTATTVGRTGFGGLTYDTAESLTVNAGNAAGSIAKLHNIESTAAGTNVALNAGSGNDSIRISNTAMLVSNIAANVNVNGQGGTDALVIQDANNVNDDVHSLSGTTYQSDNSATISYAGVEGLTLNAGAGDSDINLAGSLVTTPLTINAGNGGDSINLAALGGFAGAVTANGQGGDDFIFVNDQVPGTDAYTLTSSSLARTGFAGLTYGTSEQFVLLAEDGGNTITVNSTVGPTRIDANDGTDTINVNEAGSQAEVTLDPSAGDDTLNVNADNAGTAAVIMNASHTFGAVNVGAGGFLFSTANGAHVIRTASLSVNALGRFDLADNTLLIDYAGVSPLPTIRARLTSGYNGGAWNGPGINSSRAASTPGRALGYAEASALFSTFPVTFAGQTIDNTTVIVRYTRYGDANLDRAVNLQDFNRLVAGFGTGTLWSEGNFNYDASTNLSDFNLLSGSFGQGAPGEPDELPPLPGRHARDESR